MPTLRRVKTRYKAFNKVSDDKGDTSTSCSLQSLRSRVRNLTSDDTNFKSLIPHTKTDLFHAGKHTTVVLCGSHPTGSGWLGQGGSSAADAPGQKAMLPGPFPFGLTACICVSMFSYILPILRVLSQFDFSVCVQYLV